MIELVQVCLSRGRARILQNAFVRIDSEQVVLISGPSGIGKTSLLSLIGGFLSADSGCVSVFGRDVARLRSTSTALLRRKLAFVPQELALIEEDSAVANVRVALEVSGVGRREATRRAETALDTVDLKTEQHVPVSRLSTGQRRRVALARGLVRQADVLIADEPSNDLDAERVLRLVEQIEEMREAGGAIVMATNDPRLLAHAHQPGWRHLALCEGQLVPGDVRTLFARQEASNVVPFPVSAVGAG